MISMLRAGVEKIGFTLMPSSTPIQPVLIGEEALALSISRQLEARGLLVTAIRPPTVPEKTSRLRITLSASHTEIQVKQLLEALSDIFQGLSEQDLESLDAARTRVSLDEIS